MPRAPQLPKLTSLRFFAAFWVLGFHAIPRRGPVDAWTAFWNRGWIGVTFFFVLSGFILTYTYGREASRLDARRFWVARFARVYPLYLFAMLFAVPQLLHFLRVAGESGTPLDPGHVAGVVMTSLAMLQSWFGQLVCVWNCPSWSLSDEAFFYALFPLVLPLPPAGADVRCCSWRSLPGRR
jgi:peptidoglycan/LPS O-acetylase OafA/YrhL